MLHSTWFQVQTIAVFKYQWRPTTVWLTCNRKMAIQNWSHHCIMEIFLHKYTSLGIYSLGHISECRDSLLKNSKAKYFPHSKIKDLIPWDLLMPSIKGNGRTLTPNFYTSVQGEIIINLLSKICPKCLLAAEVRCHITAEVFRKIGVKKLMKTFIKILTVPRNFWKKSKYFR